MVAPWQSEVVGTRALLPPDTSAAFAEAWLRKYAGDSVASPDDFAWIRVASAELYISQTVSGAQTWKLVRSGEMDAKLRTKSARGQVQHYEGEKGMAFRYGVGRCSEASQTDCPQSPLR